MACPSHLVGVKEVEFLCIPHAKLSSCDVRQRRLSNFFYWFGVGFIVVLWGGTDTVSLP